MSTKIASSARSKAIRSAWRNARTAWRKTETSVGGLLRANKALFVSLGAAGAVAARRARRELESAVKSLEQSGRQAKLKFEQMAYAHAPIPAQPVRKVAGRSRKRSAA
jgi:hypothetical protein